MSVTRHWSWNDKTKILTVYCRESGAALWQHAFKQFQNASDCAAIFMALYDQGVRHGKQIALEEMCCTEDQVEVVRVPVSCPRCGGAGVNFSGSYLSGSAQCLLCKGKGRMVKICENRYRPIGET